MSELNILNAALDYSLLSDDSSADSESQSEVDTGEDSNLDTDSPIDEDVGSDIQDKAQLSESSMFGFVRHNISVLIGILLSIFYIVCGMIFQNSIPSNGLEIDILVESLKVFALYVGTLLCQLAPILGILGIAFNLLNIKFKTKLCTVYNTVVCCLSIFLLISSRMIGK